MKKQGDVYSVCTSSLDKGGIDHSTTAFRVMHVDSKGDFTSELRYTYLDKNICIASPAGVMASDVLPVAVKCVFFRVTGERSALYLFGRRKTCS